MKNKEFKVGDRVICKGVVGKKRVMYAQGIIIEVAKNFYTVKFEQDIDGYGESKREDYVNEDEITIMEESIIGLSGEEEHLAIKEINESGVSKHD
jgi:uncharacterized protein Veg